MANWLTEKEAADYVSRKPRTLRKKVKAGTWNIKIRTVNGRSFQYWAKDLEKVFEVQHTA